MDKYVRGWEIKYSYQSEDDLERDLIEDLKNQGYEYIPGLNTSELLLDNVRKQLQALNTMIFSNAESQRFIQEFLDRPSDSKVDKTRRVHDCFIFDVVDFIRRTNLDELNDKVSVIEAFFTFSQAEQIHEAQELIKPEALYCRFFKT